MSQDISYNNSCPESSPSPAVAPTPSIAQEISSVRFAHDPLFMVTDKPYENCTREEQLARRYAIILFTHQQEEREKNGLKRIFTNNEIFNLVKIKRSTGYRLIQAEKNMPGSGVLLINSAPKTDKKSKLNLSQKEEVKDCIENHFPYEYDIDLALWNRKAVQQLISLKYHISLTKKAISKWLHKEDIVLRRPEKYNIKRDDEKIEEFTKTFPTLLQKYPGFVPFFIDETHIQQDSNHERGFSPKGVASKLAHWSDTHCRVATAFMGVSSQSDFASIVEEDRTSNAYDIIDFLKLIQEKFKGRKVLVIADNARIHHAKKVEEYLKHKRNIKMEFLPPYAPDINPVELLNQILKKNIRLKAPMKKEELVQYVRDFVENIKGEDGNDTSKITKCFDSPKTAYAKAQ